MEFSYKKSTALSFDEAVQKTRNALTKEGFGVITEIDARATFKQKLGVDFDNYLILGACHPASAHQVLTADKELGLMLPCNVVVYEDQSKVWVATILPTVVINLTHNPALTALAQEIEQKLKRVVDAI